MNEPFDVFDIMTDFTEADLQQFYSELRQVKADAAAENDGGEMDDCLSWEIASCFMDDHPEAVEYLETVKGITDVQIHLADEII